MSDTNLAAPAELEFGDDKGFLDGVTVTIKSARYGKLEYPAQQDKDPIPAKISLKAVFVTARNSKELKPQDYSTGVNWENGGNVTVSPDGTALLVKPGFKLPKNSDFNHFRKTAVSAGIPVDSIKNDTRVFEGETFIMASEKNPGSGDQGKPKPYPHQRIVGGVAPTQNPTSGTSATTPTTTSTIDPALAAQIVTALTDIVSVVPDPIPFMKLFNEQHLNNYFDRAGIDGDTRATLSRAIFTNKSGLETIVAGSAVKYVDGNVSKA